MRSERWPWLGEPLAIDFANTVRRRGSEYEELLREPADLSEWAELEQGRVPVPDDASRLDETRAIRDAVFALLRAAAQDETPPAGAVDRVNAAARGVVLVPQLRGDAVELAALGSPDPVDELHARVATSALELLSEPGLALCDAPSCGQFFLRHRGDQRWCGTACGVRARVARHAASRSQAVHSASSTASSGTPGARTQ